MYGVTSICSCCICLFLLSFNPKFFELHFMYERTYTKKVIIIIIIITSQSVSKKFLTAWAGETTELLWAVYDTGWPAFPHRQHQCRRLQGDTSCSTQWRFRFWSWLSSPHSSITARRSWLVCMFPLTSEAHPECSSFVDLKPSQVLPCSKTLL